MIIVGLSSADAGTLAVRTVWFCTNIMVRIRKVLPAM